MMLRSTLGRWHVWLGWLVGVPMLLWTLSGLVMVLKPVEEVRGVGLLASAPAVRLTAPPVLPSEVAGLPLTRISLEQRSAGPRWVIELAGGPARLSDPASGRFLPPPGAAEVAAEVRSRWRGTAGVAGVKRTTAEQPPIDFRRSVAAWQVQMSDGTFIYVDAATGEILAVRTRWWRLYDWMWGLHVMDLNGREDSHHPLLVGFAALSLLAVLLALVLLPLSYMRRRP